MNVYHLPHGKVQNIDFFYLVPWQNLKFLFLVCACFELVVIDIWAELYTRLQKQVQDNSVIRLFHNVSITLEAVIE